MLLWCKILLTSVQTCVHLQLFLVQCVKICTQLFPSAKESSPNPQTRNPIHGNNIIITVWLHLKQTAECKYVSRLSQYSSQWPLLSDSAECPAVGPQWRRCWGDHQTRWQLLVGSPRHSLLGHAMPTFQRESWDSHQSPQWEGTHQGIDH